MSNPNQHPGAPSPEGLGCGGCLALIGIVAVLGVGLETMDNIQNYQPYNPPQERIYDPFSWLAVPLTEEYMQQNGYRPR